ncbi:MULTISPECIES: SprT-like domain-containing protein [Frankia]|uniref:SprT-like domain-containing protein n=1 Tax=Frankia TaxID=1854 RepID=UPI0005D0F38C|nr:MULTISPECIES: SprT-like domain-containing protein [Frankia]
MAHRRATAALAAGRDDLKQLHELWATYNVRYYGGAMAPPYILLDEPSVPRRYGQFAARGGLGGRGQIMIRPSLLAGTHPHLRDADETTRRRFVADVLLHESIHQWQHEVAGRTDRGYHGHGPAFRDRANEIGAALGLPPVRTAKRRGPDADLPSCAQWPHCVRPVDHYAGSYVPASGDTDLIAQIIETTTHAAALWEQLGPHDLDDLDVNTACEISAVLARHAVATGGFTHVLKRQRNPGKTRPRSSGDPLNTTSRTSR